MTEISTNNVDHNMSKKVLQNSNGGDIEYPVKDSCSLRPQMKLTHQMPSRQTRNWRTGQYDIIEASQVNRSFKFEWL